MKKIIVSGLLALSVGFASFGGFHSTEVHAATISSSVKTIKGYTLQYNVPKDVTVVLYANQAVIKRHGQVVGGIEFLAYDGKQPTQTLLPNHVSVLNSRTVNGLALPCVRYLVQSDSKVQSYHSLLLDSKKKRAFDFWVNAASFTDKEIKDIRASIKVLH